MTFAEFTINDSSRIISPGLVVFPAVLKTNLAMMIQQAGDVSRLRPHCKTHKMAEVTRLQLELGITRHKCATFAEAEMLAEAGVTDILLAYNMVGPNITRAVRFRQKYPTVTLIITADHIEPVRQLSMAMEAAGTDIHVLLDLDSGQHRTGICSGAAALDLYKQISESAGLTAAGIHLYDGQIHQTDLTERTTAVMACWKIATMLRDELQTIGLEVPRIVAGGTGSFPVYAEIDDPQLELSPGTNTFFDNNYGLMFPDLSYTPAARILTRVISRAAADSITLDLGYKACASDPPLSKRVTFPDLPDAEPLLQNEEHLVIRTSQAAIFTPGDELLAIPGHICPTSALHKSAFIVEDGEVTGTWAIASRDRWLTI